MENNNPNRSKFYLTFEYTHINPDVTDNITQFSSEMKYSSIVEAHIMNALYFSMKSLALIVIIDDMELDFDDCKVYLNTYIDDETIEPMLYQWNISNVNVKGSLDDKFVYVANNFKIHMS